MSDQLGLGVDVPRVAKRSTSRVVRRPVTQDVTPKRSPLTELSFTAALAVALDRAGVAPGDSFYVARVPPATRKSHLGDLNGPLGSRADQRLKILRAFAIFDTTEWAASPGGRGSTASVACGLAGVGGGWRRVSELVQGGHLAPTGEKRENVPGRPARVLAITDRGRAALEATREA